MARTTLVIPGAAHISQFYDGYHGTCMETALAVAIGCVTGQPATQDQMVAITRSLQSQGLADSRGATTITACGIYARAHGLSIIEEIQYGQDASHWLSILRQYKATNPILVEIANGQALRDGQTGSHDEYGLHYHGITVVGVEYDPNDANYGGYWCADSDNPQVSQRFQLYDWNTLAAAQPCGLIVFAMPVKRTYTVQAGDTLSGIAGKLGYPDWHVLYNQNSAIIGGNPNIIKPRQVLTY